MRSHRTPEVFVIGAAALSLLGCASQETKTKTEAAPARTEAREPDPTRVTGIVGLPTETHEHMNKKAAEPAPTVKEAKADQQPAGPWLAVPTGQRSTSTLLLEKIAPAEVIAGQPYAYDIRVTNLTDGAIDNVIVTDTLPREFKLANSTPRQEAGEGGVTTWVLGPMAPREVKNIHLTGTATDVGKITSCASASFSSALCSTVNVVLPVLRVTLVTPPEAILCDSIPARITLTNSGTGTARNVRVVEPLLAGLTTADGKNALEFAVPALAAGETKEFDVTLKAEKPGMYTTSAFATADAGLKGSSSEATIRVTQPVLTVAVKGPDRLFVGRPITYDITVTNTGDGIAKETVIENPIPAGATFVSGTDNAKATATAVTWTLGALPPKATKTVKATFNAPNIGDVKTTAMARAYCANPVSASAASVVTGIPALLLEGFDSPDPVQIGESTVYTLVLTNQGSAPLTNVRLVCTMDEADMMQYASSQGVTVGSTSNRTITFAPIAKLDAKQIVTYKVTVKAAKEGQVQFKAEAVSDQITRPLIKVETTNFYR